MRYNFVCVLAISGEKDEALKMLASTISLVGEYQVRIIESDPDLDSLREDPRFQTMVAAAKARVGLRDAS
jgi:adenylate cyclase